MGSDAGGERAASLYSLVETAKQNGLDPEAYLREVLGRIADHPMHEFVTGEGERYGEPDPDYDQAGEGAQQADPADNRAAHGHPHGPIDGTDLAVRI